MGAEVTWFPPAPRGPRRIGALRYGAAFRSSGARHGYDGCGVVCDLGNGTALIGPLSSGVGAQGAVARMVWRLLGWLLGRPAEFSRRDWHDILGAIAAEGFRRVEFERHGRWYAVDLARLPWRMKRLRGAAARVEPRG